LQRNSSIHLFWIGRGALSYRTTVNRVFMQIFEEVTRPSGTGKRRQFACRVYMYMLRGSGSCSSCQL